MDPEAYIIHVILTGWKEIASRLRSGMRTVQRWERAGLPVSRPFPGSRSPVIADSELLDTWMRNSAFRRTQDFGLLDHIQRTRELRAETQRERQLLHERMKALRQEMAAVRATIEQLQRSHGDGRNTKTRHQSAGS